MAKTAFACTLYGVLLLALLLPDASAAVVWYSGCDSTSGWTVVMTPVRVTDYNIHTAPGAFCWDNSVHKMYTTWPDTPAGSALGIRFWFNDADTASQGGSAPCIEFRTADRSAVNVVSFCLNDFVGSNIIKYQFRCLGAAGGTNYYNGAVNRSLGWHRVEMLYPGELNAYTWTVDGTVHFTRTPTGPMSFGSVSVGLGIGMATCAPLFRVDTVAVMDAPRKLAFTTSPGGGDIAVSITTPSGLQTGVLAANHRDGYYDAAEEITLAAPNLDGLTFSGWSSTCGGTFGTPNAPTTTYTGATGDGTITANYVGGGCTPPTGATHLSRISDIWPLANDDTVYNLTGKTVTAVWPDGFWVEESDRSAGIKVLYPAGSCTIGAAVVAGASVDVYGTLATGDERVINASVVSNNGAGTAVEPLGVISKYIGGRAVNANTPAVVNGKGIYGIGLLVKIAGSLSLTGSEWYLDDGSGLLNGSIKGMKVISLTTPAAGSRTVTGVIGIIGGKPVIYATDIR